MSQLAWGEGAPGTWGWGEARDAARHPTTPRGAPIKKELLSPNGNNNAEGRNFSMPIFYHVLEYLQRPLSAYRGSPTGLSYIDFQKIPSQSLI